MKRLLIVAFLSAVAWTLSPTSSRQSFTTAAQVTPSVTFSNQIVRVFQGNCQSCHHPGGFGPFSLMTYEDAAPYAEVIKQRTSTRAMPPYQPKIGCGEFVGEQRLTDEQIALIAGWVDAGAPEGDRADLPPPLTFDDTPRWLLGEPDVVLANAARGYRVPPNLGDDIFQCFSVPTGFTVDHYLSGLEIRPGTNAVVHHVLLFLDVDGSSVRLDRAYPGPGYECEAGAGFDAPVLLSWNPGAPPVEIPAGIGIRIPAGSRLVMQVHYSSGSEAKVDTTLVGLHFARTPVVKERYVMQPRNESFVIPAGAKGFRVSATGPVSEDITLNTITPHMHRLGTDIEVEARMPDGGSLCLIDLDWDVRQQGTYVFKTPVRIPAGTVFTVAGTYDNSVDNPDNPNDPPQDVHWGRESYNEMLFSFLGFTRDSEALTPSNPDISRVEVRGGKLVISATDLRPGAFIEVGGRLVRDSRFAASKGRVSSAADWKHLIGRGEEASLTILNPDGARSRAVSFLRP